MKTVKNESHTIFNEVNNNDGILQNYPSFDEILTNQNYKFQMICSPSQYDILKTEKSKWEIVVKIVNYMCMKMYEIPFYESYSFKPTEEFYDYNKCINIGGDGFVYDSQGKIHTVDYETFLKLTLVMYLSFMKIKLTDEQRESYFKFKASSYIVGKVLD